MEFNKDYVIYSMTVIIVLLLGYIIFQKPSEKIVLQTKYEKIVEEKYMYQDKECEKKSIIEKEIISTLDTFNEENHDLKEYVITSTNDSTHRYLISLISFIKPIKVNNYKKVVLNGTLKYSGLANIFIMDINQVLLNELNDVYFKIKDKQTDKEYFGQYSCINNLIENFIYKVDLEISGEEILCDIYEDRVLDNNRDVIIQNKVKDSPENTFLNMQSSIVSTSTKLK